MFSSVRDTLFSAVANVRNRVTSTVIQNPEISAVTALFAGASVISNPKGVLTAVKLGVLTAVTNKAGRWLIDHTGQKLVNMFSNGSSVELENRGKEIDFTVRGDEKAKTVLKFTMGTAALMAILTQRKPIASVMRQLPAGLAAGLARLIPPQDLLELYIYLQGLASRSKGLLTDAVVATGNAANMAGRVMSVVAQRVPDPLRRVVAGATAAAAHAIGRRCLNAIPRPIGDPEPVVIEDEVRYDLSGRASLIHEDFFSEQTMRVEDVEGNGTRFSRACINGVATNNAQDQSKVTQMQAELKELLRPAYKTRLDDSVDFGYSVDMKKGELTIAVPSSNTDPNDYAYYRYDLQNGTAIEEFIEKFGRHDLTVEEVIGSEREKSFLRKQRERFKVEVYRQVPVASAGKYEFDSAGLIRLFGGHASQLCSVMSAADYQRMLLEHNAKLGLMKDYYEQVIRSNNASDDQKSNAREQLDKVAKLNTKQTLEVSRFLEHAMQVRARGATAEHSMSVRRVIEQVSLGAMDTRELGAAFSEFVDYAEALANEDPAIVASQRDDAAIAKMKQAKVSSLVNLFIGLVTAKAKQVGMSDGMRLGIQSLRGLQQRLIEQGKLKVLRYDAQRTALEGDLAALRYADFQAKFEERLAEHRDQTAFGNSIYTEEAFGRMMDGEAAEQRADTTHTHLLATEGLNVRRRGRDRSDSAPEPLMRHSGSFSGRVHALALVERDPDTPCREADSPIITHWANFTPIARG